jgi:hypothetical protein
MISFKLKRRAVPASKRTVEGSSKLRNLDFEAEAGT